MTKLAVALLTLFSVHAYAAGGIDAKITAETPIVLDNDGNVSELQLAAPISQIQMRENHRSAILRTQECLGAATNKCGSHLGLLAKPLILKANIEGVSTTIVIPARGASVFNVGNCSKDGLPTVLQINLKDRTKEMAIDYLGTEGKSALEAIAADDAVVKKAIADFESKVKAGAFAEARLAFSKTRNMTLLSSEVRQLLSVRSLMPVDQQPIDTTADSVNRDLSKLVERDIDAMTMSEYVDFFTSYFSTFRNEQHDIDDTYAFRLLRSIKASKEDSVKILKTAIDTSIEGIIAFAKAGGQTTGLQFTSQYILGQALDYLPSTMPPAEFQAYLGQAKAKVQSAMAADPNVAAVFSGIWFRNVSLVK